MVSAGTLREEPSSPESGPSKLSSSATAEPMRLDLLLVQRGCFASREKARRAILAGCVAVDGAPAVRPGAKVSVDSRVVVEGDLEPFVSRGGRKLAAALDRMAKLSA